jgi:hypothetical protein
MRSFVNGMLAVAVFVAVPGIASAKRCDNDAAGAAARGAAAAQCDCATAENHGQYVKCVGDVAKTRASNGQLPTECKGEVARCAAKSTCGKPEAVTCCRVDRRGKVRCSTKSNADKCRPPNGGAACVGATTSCCDACTNACGGGTTTTVTPTPSTAAATTAGAPTSAAAPTPSAPPTTTTLPGSASHAFVD